MRIIDETGMFSDQHLQMLLDFIERELLSNVIDRAMLHKVAIVYRPYSDYDGSWQCRKIESQNGTDTIRCVIFLNAFFTREFETKDKEIEQFKKVLAHEYGHHWTLSYLIKNHDFDCKTRLPREYYDRRGLEESMCSAAYADNSWESWYRCDKEIIAEDYKFLFAPDRYGKPHRIVEDEEAKAIIELENPNESVHEFIRDIHILPSLF
jgi:predicted Zn-dependent protease with MMP-like domain